MASYKKPGQANLVRPNQLWRHKVAGKVWIIVRRGNRSHEWTFASTKKGTRRGSHHITEGTLLKYWEMV